MMDPRTSFVSWLVSAMTAWYPPATNEGAYTPALVKAHPEIVESVEDMKKRYESIATDLTTIVYSSSYVPINSGNNARGKDAMYALGIASYESGGFRKDVDIGITFGANGHDVCLMQVWMPPYLDMGTTKEGWTLKDIAVDRTKCFITGLDRMRNSWRQCVGHHLLDRMAVYTIGHCQKDEEKSRTRMARAWYWMNKHPVPVTDNEILNPEE